MTGPSSERVTVPQILAAKSTAHKVTAVTAYDYAFARIVDSAGIEIILVGDSLGMVVQGGANTLAVTLDEMIYHCRCVTRGVMRALVVGDMPFLSYQVSKEQAILAAGRLVKEGGVAAVKLEGGRVVADTVQAITAVDIPVMGHIGLTPQSVHRIGGFKMQGKPTGAHVSDKGSWEQLLDDARALEDAGAFAVVAEAVPSELGAELTRALSIPVIGIGAGSACDGQILVLHDLLGLSSGHSPRFVKHYADLKEVARHALTEYRNEVQSGSFPGAEHAYHLPQGKLVGGVR